MGFGTLFIGYFLLLNLTYYGITDIIAAAVMLLGLYKLSPINKYFRYSVIASIVFLVFSLSEFGVAIYEMFFSPISSQPLISFFSVVRCMVVATLSMLILKGIEFVAKEVELEDLAKKASRMLVATAVTYSLWIVLEAPVIDSYILAVLSVITILATIALLIVNLSIIYSSYMKICMPGDESNDKQKPSRFAFVNEYRARKEERYKETAEKRAEIIKSVKDKQKGNKK